MDNKIKPKEYQLTVRQLIDLATQIERDGDEIVYKPEGEETLLKLLWLRDFVDRVYDAVKIKLEMKALELNPTFTAIRGSKVRVGYRYFGAKYKLANPEDVTQLPDSTYSKKTTYTLEQKVIDDLVTKIGKLPDGIELVERKKTITITTKNEPSV